MNRQPRKYHIGAMLMLVLASTLMAELLEGSTPVSRINYLLPQFLFYGPAAILIREISRRLDRGWITIILLGWAFGIAEESLVLQTVFNTSLFNLDFTFGRFAGVNWVWAEYITGFHACWSITGAILLCETIFHKDSQRPWAGKYALWVFGLIMILVFVAFHFLFVNMNKFEAPAHLKLISIIIIIGLTVAALLAPRQDRGMEQPASDSSRFSWMAGAITFIAGILWFLGLATVFMPHKPDLVLTVVMGPFTALLYFMVMLRSPGFSMQHYRQKVSVAGGLLLSELLFGFNTTSANKTDQVGQVILTVLTVVLIIYLFKREGTLVRTN